MSDDLFERLDVLHDEMTAAYQTAAESLERCQATGLRPDVIQHLADRRRALQVSNEYHLEDEQVWLAELSRLDGAT